MATRDVYKLLSKDLLSCCDVDLSQAENIVEFLQNEGFIDYDQLKEYYLYPEED